MQRGAATGLLLLLNSRIMQVLWSYQLGHSVTSPLLRCTPNDTAVGCARHRCKALIMRDYQLLWVLSIGFELMELTFQHMLPNFNECWWDSWILDVAVCNFLGMWAGMKVRTELSAVLAPRCRLWQAAVTLVHTAEFLVSHLHGNMRLLLLFADVYYFFTFTSSFLDAFRPFQYIFVLRACRRWSGPRRRTTTGAG